MSQACKRVGDGRVVAERSHDAHDVGVLEEDELAGVVVVGERTERLGAQRDLRGASRGRSVRDQGGGRRGRSIGRQ